MESVLLSARCTANTATVFWNKPENATADTVYEFLSMVDILFTQIGHIIHSQN